MIDIPDFLTGICLHSDLNELARYSLDKIAQGLGFTDPMLVVQDEDKYLVKRLIHGEIAEEIIIEDRKRSLIKYVARQQKPVNRFEYDKGRLFSSRHTAFDDAYAFCCIVPLISVQRTSGFLFFNHPSSRKPLNEDNWKFFSQLMIPLGLAIDVALSLQTKGKLDPETGLYRKHSFFDEFSQELRRTTLMGQSLTLGILQFKDWEDLIFTHGEDSVLALEVMAGVELRKFTRANDTVFRFGNGRFVLVLAETPKQVGEGVLQRLKTYLEQLYPAWEARAGFGCAGFPNDGDTTGRLFIEAEAMLR
ncbi:MAG TPA: diguanylate cyclase [Verrucomicrobiae bacterium]|nr:diguanylate cyclase [Verrucomicrobiae bacterium]